MKFRLLPLAIALLATLSACKKEKTEVNSDVEAQTHSQDQSYVSSEMDQVTNEVSLAIEQYGPQNGRTSVICNATVTADTMSNPRTITITYDGLNCFGTHDRTGVVTISIPAGTRWRDAGAVITVDYNNLHITRISDDKSITIDGAHTITNVSGGLLFQLAQLGSITHAVASTGMTITFDDGTQRNWQVARQRVFTYSGGIVVSITGTHSDGTTSNIAEWGTNRFGRAFSTATTEPMVIRQDCSFRLTDGTLKHKLPAGEVTAAFGLDATGAPTGCPGLNPYYYKLTWTGNNGNSMSLILPY